MNNTDTITESATPAAVEPCFVAVSPYGIGGSWGSGASIDEAKQQCRSHGGNLNHVIVYQLPDGATNGHVDDIGNLQWMWSSEQARLAWVRSPVDVVYRRGVTKVTPTG